MRHTCPKTLTAKKLIRQALLAMPLVQATLSGHPLHSDNVFRELSSNAFVWLADTLASTT